MRLKVGKIVNTHSSKSVDEITFTSPFKDEY